jgi:EAL domain-containing protein (putative c-di-GMP-specific phosphodiesterase class I)/ActR/RegA family two-component response regulator
MSGQQIRKQILAVDGENSFVDFIAGVLQTRDFDTLTAGSAEGAIQKAESLDIDLILIGEGLSDSASFLLCKRLKSNPRTEHIPVMVLSRTSESESRIRAYHFGADDFMTKDFQPEELFARIDAIWRRGNGDFRKLRDERKNKVLQELSRIIDNELVEPYFQPIYLLKPFRLLGLEVLSRPPDDSFIRTSEELFKSAIKHDMYYALEVLCWRKACEMVSLKTRHEQLFFNCHPFIVENGKFGAVKIIFEKSQIPFSNIVLEITERSAIHDHAVYYNRLDDFRRSGFTFAVDDVGGGYSSLESIVITKPEIVKIDQHIIRDLHQDPIKRSIVKFIVSFCRENTIVSIAEGIENQEEYNTVLQLGVDAAQGFFLYRPTACIDLHAMKDIAISFV